MKDNMKAYPDLRQRIDDVLKAVAGKGDREAILDQIFAILAEYDDMVQTTRDGIVRQFLFDNLKNSKASSLLERLENIRAFHKVDEDERKGD